jgi:hypothetical protein
MNLPTAYDDPNVLIADEASVGLSTYEDELDVTITMRAGEILVIAPLATVDATALAMALLEAVQEVITGQPPSVQ